MPDWTPKTARTKAILADLIAVYEAHDAAGTLPRGGRGAFYDLRPSGHSNGVTYYKPDSAHPKKSFGPMEAHPDLVQDVLGKARRAGFIPEHWVADGRAQPRIGKRYDDSAAERVEQTVRLVRHAEDRFELDPQRGQPIYIEVLCEAADLAPRLARVANGFGVRVYIGAGFDGMKAKRAMGERAAERNVPTVVLHVSDRDKHGDDIYVAAAEDAIAWAGSGVVADKHLSADSKLLVAIRDDLLSCPGELFSFRLGLTPAQADSLGVLDADGKAEADAVPVPVMDGWLTEAIEALQDPARRDALEAEQERDREGILANVLAQLSENGDGE
jgi:hypothetical protein